MFQAMSRSNRPRKFNRHAGCAHKRTHGKKPKEKK